MSLLNKPASVLTHGGNSSDAVASAIKTRADHHAETNHGLYAGGGVDELPASHMAYNPNRTPGQPPKPGAEWPKHVHATASNPTAGHLQVENEEQYKAAIDSGYWQDLPVGHPDTESEEAVEVKSEQGTPVN